MTELHPIQLRDISVSRLNVVVNDPAVATNYEGEVDLEFKIGTSDFEEDDPHIAVGFNVTALPMPKENPPFLIEVELSGQFEVDLKKFKFEHLHEWSRTNAPFLLLPYVREHIYGLALRAGIKSFALPLFVQPIRPSSSVGK